MKHLLFPFLLLITLSGRGQTNLLARLDSLDHGGKWATATTGGPLTRQADPVYDTINVIMLLSDTAASHKNPIQPGTPWYGGDTWAERGYEVRKPSGPRFYIETFAEWVTPMEHVAYLNYWNKQSTIYLVWLSKEIK